MGPILTLKGEEMKVLSMHYHVSQGSAWSLPRREHHGVFDFYLDVLIFAPQSLLFPFEIPTFFLLNCLQQHLSVRRETEPVFALPPIPGNTRVTLLGYPRSESINPHLALPVATCLSDLSTLTFIHFFGVLLPHKPMTFTQKVSLEREMCDVRLSTFIRIILRLELLPNPHPHA